MSEISVLRIQKNDSLKTIYAKAKRAFTAADFQRFTDLEEGISAREVIAELQALDREQRKRARKKPKNGRG